MLYHSQEENRILIKKDSSDYILNVNTNSDRFNEDELFFQFSQGLITGRSIKQYPDIVMNPHFQYIEIGAGISEFIPSFVKKFGKTIEYKPIVIDPANYILMKDMVSYATNLNLGEKYDLLFNKYIERINIITNPSKVSLLNLKLGDAVKKHAEILGVGDIIIDICGPSLFPYFESANKTESDLIKLILSYKKKLKKNSSSFQNYCF